MRWLHTTETKQSAQVASSRSLGFGEWVADQYCLAHPTNVKYTANVKLKAAEVKFCSTMVRDGRQRATVLSR